jgi:ribonuclease BN (tRNA processing enzyme)
MEFIVLGSGTSVPHPTRSSSAFWLETPGGKLLLDCSASAIHRMAQERLDWAGIDAIWISHFHLDHCGGLAPLLFATKHASETQDRTKPLRIFGGGGLRQLVEKFDEAGNHRLLEQPFPIEIIEIGHLEQFEILSDVEAIALSTPHKEESLAIRLRDNNDRTLVYSADTGFTEDLATFARNVDLFVLECSFVKNKPVEWHLELAEAIYLIRKAEPKKAMLTHLYPEWDDVDFELEVKKSSPECEVLQAIDGLRLEL